MIFESIELHNTAETLEPPGKEGVMMQRVPESVRIHLNEIAQTVVRRPGCAEIRFVSESFPARIRLSCVEKQARFVIFWGDFQESADIHFLSTEPQTFELSPPSRFFKFSPEELGRMPFFPRVCRLIFQGNPIIYHGIEGEGVRPPTPEELPALRYLAYGTSITQGGAATLPHLSYPAQAARHISADLINLGLGASCHCEPEMADYIAAREDWHLASLALSTNMIGAGFTTEEFHKRVSYMVNTVAGSNLKRPVACISIFPQHRDLGEPRPSKSKVVEFRTALREAVQACPHSNAHFYEGPDIMTDLYGLTADLLHPADHGMIQMGHNLGRKLRELLNAD